MNILFKKIQVTVILTSLGLILGIGFLLDYKKPHYAQAECAEINPIVPSIENPDEIFDYGASGDSAYLTLGEIQDTANVRRRVCFLNYVGMENVGNDDRYALCSIYEESGNWVLKASGAGNHDLKATCSASCLCWPSGTDPHNAWCEGTKWTHPEGPGPEEEGPPGDDDDNPR